MQLGAVSVQGSAKHRTITHKSSMAALRPFGPFGDIALRDGARLSPFPDMFTGDQQ